MPLTKEQEAIVDAVCFDSTDSRIIAVNAVAGSGKTSTADAVIRAYNPSNGFYTAFNRAIVQDSEKRFGKMLQCKTIHSLAYKYVKPKKPIQDLNYLTITEPLSYEEKAIVIETIDDFFRSSSTDLEEYARYKVHDEGLQNLILEYADKMLRGEINPTFNFLLKNLHLQLLDQETRINFDLLILDECQDTTAVTLEIFKLINAKKKLILGDKFQNIYSFMNTVNAFEELDDLNLLRLTKSFRCNPQIAATVEEFGRKYLEPDFQYKGNEEISGNPQSLAFITRTNSALIERMDLLMDTGHQFKLTRKADEIFSLPIALLNASAGKPVLNPKYKFLQKEYERYAGVNDSFTSFFDYLAIAVNDDTINSACRVLMKLKDKKINLYDLLAKVKAMKPDPRIVLTTSHAFKGLEADNVVIEEDLNNSVNKVITRLKILKEDLPFGEDIFELKKYLDKSDREDLNTYYVALSRARMNISNVGYR